MSKAESGKQKAEMGPCETERGFSLVEVNLAIFVVAIGLLTLFSLFPVGLKQGEEGHEETQMSMFAAYVLDGMRANAMGVSAADWDRMAVAVLEFQNNLGIAGPNSIRSMEYPASLNPLTYVRYLWEVDYDSGLDLYKVTLWVQGGEYGVDNVGRFKYVSKKYYTELFYSGMP
jgi:hypothetical protein